MLFGFLSLAKFTSRNIDMVRKAGHISTEKSEDVAEADND